MQNSTKVILISCAVLALIGIFCVVAGLAGWFTFLRIADQQTEVNLPEVTQGARATQAIPTRPAAATAQATPPATAESTEMGEPAPTQGAAETAAPTAAIPADTLAEMEEIQQQVTELRGLQTGNSFSQELITPEQLRQRMEADLKDEYSPEEAADDVKVLAAFGLIEPEFDYYNFYLDLLTEQVAGFYDRDTQTMYVIQGESFAGPERFTYAHEYVHFLQDQAYDFEQGLNMTDEACEDDTERCAAIQALVEGDASLSALNWLITYSPGDILEIQGSYDTYESPVYDRAPEFLKQDFIFPYQQGQTFVTSLFERDGYAAVDQAFENLPVSTEQILHPERYPEDTPAVVDLPDLAGTLGAGWRELDRNVIGEWYTYLILAQGNDPEGRISDEQAQRAAEGWGGDTYAVWYNDSTGQRVLVARAQWDSEADAGQFAAAFEEHTSGRFGNPSNDLWQAEGGVTSFHQEGATTTWILAPDAATAESLWQALQ